MKIESTRYSYERNKLKVAHLCMSTSELVDFIERQFSGDLEGLYLKYTSAKHEATTLETMEEIVNKISIVKMPFSLGNSKLDIEFSRISGVIISYKDEQKIIAELAYTELTHYPTFPKWPAL